MLRIIVLFFLLLPRPLLFAQTVERPVRGVTDPGVVTTRQQITPAGVPTIFQGRVFGVTFGASSSELWVLTASAIYRLDWQQNRAVQIVALERNPGLQGILWDASGNRPLVTATDKKNQVRLLAVEHGATKSLGDVLGSQIAGAPAIAGGATAVVPLIYNNKIAIVDLKGTRPAAWADTGIAPFGAAVNRAGTVAYVSNWGGRLPKAGDLTARTGYSPEADQVVVDKRGIASTGTVTRIDLTSAKATDAIPVELHPTAILLDEPRNRLYVANGNKDTVSVIDTQQNRVSRTFEIQPFTQKAFGIAPTAVALSPDGSKLYVACGGINAVAVINTNSGAIDGLIPTAWYPNALAVSSDGKRIAIGSLLGVGSAWQQEPRKRFVHSYRGSVSVVEIPDAAQLASYTTAVAENNHLPVGPLEARSSALRNAKPIAIPARSGEPSLIEHVVYIVKENRTYDQVFGDMPKGNGDVSLVMFGEDVTGNQHRLADQFVLLDNFYATGGNSGDGHQWVTQANETAYCLWPGYRGRSYPFDGSDPIAYSSSGFIWDAALAQGKTVRVYGEYAGRMSETDHTQRKGLIERWQKGDDFTRTWHIEAPIQPLNKILASNYPSYTNAIPDVVRSQIFLADLKSWQSGGHMPNFVILQLPCDHTYGTTPGASTPKAMVADNDVAVGRIVEALTKSQFWRKMAIFIVEDDAQDGVDHVDGHRTTALAISPYTRRRHVDSTFYSHQSILKTIELILGLPTLSLFDLIANDMRASFQNTPDDAGYTAVMPKQSLLELNPEVSALNGAARKAAIDSMKMRWEVPDAAPTERLNRILWGQIRGWRTPYPATRRAAFAPLALEVEDEEREE